MTKLRLMLPKSIFVTISQSTKDVKMCGSYELIHDSDVVVQVEDGVAASTKNRFKESDKTNDIF